MANKKHKDGNKPFKWKHSVGEIILWLVRWYCRYALSYTDLKEMAAERSLELDRSTIFRWVQEYGPEINKRVRPHLKNTSDSWKLDETYVKIKGIWHYLYRAIDKCGDTLDWLLSKHCNKKAAKRFFKKLLRNSNSIDPRVINVDKSRRHLLNCKQQTKHPKKQNFARLNISIIAWRMITNLRKANHAIGNGINHFRLQKIRWMAWSPCV